GADINKIGSSGRTTLGEACRWGNVKMVDFLINQGANIEQPNPAFQDATPLNVAVLSKQPKVVEYLISKGAKVDHVMKDGRTSVIKAKDADDMPMIDLLLQADLNNNFADNNGFVYQLAKNYNSPNKSY
ncbi:hypothetical protein HELRODRAFT_88948, partial [Helobdella robusta]|uniref:Uncharacterized protein n=1 Tax=Helobdella robusta TaxID=6412 RepID=T1G775_HELRO